jgi:hypothetical protein
LAEDLLIRALAAGARAFADALEAELGPERRPAGPEVGSAESMQALLERVAAVNAQGRGATAVEVSRFAREAGMDPRGTAGYHHAGLLESRGANREERWITELGKERLRRLQAGAA